MCLTVAVLIRLLAIGVVLVVGVHLLVKLLSISCLGVVEKTSLPALELPHLGNDSRWAYQSLSESHQGKQNEETELTDVSSRDLGELLADLLRLLGPIDDPRIRRTGDARLLHRDLRAGITGDG